MRLTRRNLLGSGVALAATAATARTLILEPAPALAACQVLPPASLASVALNRLAYGMRAQDLATFNALGATPDERYERWVEQQLNPATIDDSECEQLIANARLKIRYGTVNQARPLEWLGASTAELWTRVNGGMTMDWSERIRPFNEVRVATWIRAVHSRRQLFEILVDFWHNHFNVKATSDGSIAATWPAYDRLIRTHALGNFRTFVEEVGKSVAMMLYLDNASNRAAGGEGGNENYARELFELHTLGSDNYLKFYDNRGLIETISYGSETFPRGYIDDDVYEAARCFTGWTIANGRDGRPNTGEFYYLADWHDTNPKTVLAVRPAPGIPPAANIGRNQPGLTDGQQVFELLCNHPGTARHICTKLARRLIADDPPQRVIDAAVEVWMANRRAPDQIRQVVRAIVLSPECRATFGRKMRRPLEAMWAFLRATNARLPNDVESVEGDATRGGYWGSLFYTADQSGHYLFDWDTPTGHPDTASYWANTNSMLARWNSFFSMTQGWGGNVSIDIIGQTNLNASCREIVDEWSRRLCGFELTAHVRTELINFLAFGGDPNAPPRPTPRAPDWGAIEGVHDRVRAMVQLLAMSPEFNLR
ncbi:MAG: DUF1800 domain-containing protein [Chloroflexaceae bacterium]|nr:DUF1800 domain-containing protein [Chloroflexaceae bacterium]